MINQQLGNITLHYCIKILNLHLVYKRPCWLNEHNLKSEYTTVQYFQTCCKGQYPVCCTLLANSADDKLMTFLGRLLILTIAMVFLNFGDSFRYLYSSNLMLECYIEKIVLKFLYSSENLSTLYMAKRIITIILDLLKLKMASICF